MHCNTKFFDSQAEKNIGSRIDHFFHSYRVGSLLNQAGIRKLGKGWGQSLTIDWIRTRFVQFSQYSRYDPTIPCVFWITS